MGIQYSKLVLLSIYLCPLAGRARWEENGTGGEWSLIELPGRTSETHAKETPNSTWHLFKNHPLKLWTEYQIVLWWVMWQHPVGTYFSSQRYKEPTMIKTEIRDIPSACQCYLHPCLPYHWTTLPRFSVLSRFAFTIPMHIYSFLLLSIELFILLIENMLPSFLFHLIFMSTWGSSGGLFSLLQEIYRYHLWKSTA
jgi:hypothetical protein